MPYGKTTGVYISAYIATKCKNGVKSIDLYRTAKISATSLYSSKISGETTKHILLACHDFKILYGVPAQKIPYTNTFVSIITLSILFFPCFYYSTFYIIFT